MPELSARFEEALVYAARLHIRQKRKTTQIPYISHLLSVTALVLEDGGDEDQAIAALLHDAAEDQGGQATLDEIRKRFGERVAFIVESCSDAFGSPKPPWRDRKESYLAHLREAPADVRRVSLADKVHNARSILVSLQKEGDVVWDRFNGGREGSLWYYRSLVQVFRQTGSDFMTGELERTLAEIESLTR
jgi:(p)ppGpp synthase/HD superfamily hydrolase